MKGYIFDVKHFAVHDGPGIRTTVFLKGCPLKCIWCHNPESIQSKSQLGFVEHSCVNCGKCVSVCPNGAHYFDENNIHRFDREKCVLCGECAKVCYSKALSFYGRYAEIDELIDDVLLDVDFYEESGGGVTLSGGECLIQADFCEEFLKKAKEKNLHTAVDTCGFVSKNTIDRVAPFTDLFLYDIKAFDEDVHSKCTGQSNKAILENLEYIDSLGKKAEIRIPFVPGYNDNQIEKIGKFLSTLKNISGVRILPYHNYAVTKYNSLGMKNTLPETIPTDDETAKAENIIASFGIKVLK